MNVYDVSIFDSISMKNMFCFYMYTQKKKQLVTYPSKILKFGFSSTGCSPSFHQGFPEHLFTESGGKHLDIIRWVLPSTICPIYVRSEIMFIETISQTTILLLFKRPTKAANNRFVLVKPPVFPAYINPYFMLSRGTQNKASTIV